MSWRWCGTQKSGKSGICCWMSECTGIQKKIVREGRSENFFIFNSVHDNIHFHNTYHSLIPWHLLEVSTCRTRCQHRVPKKYMIQGYHIQPNAKILKRLVHPDHNTKRQSFWFFRYQNHSMTIGENSLHHLRHRKLWIIVVVASSHHLRCPSKSIQTWGLRVTNHKCCTWTVHLSSFLLFCCWRLYYVGFCRYRWFCLRVVVISFSRPLLFFRRKSCTVSYQQQARSFVLKVPVVFVGDDWWNEVGTMMCRHFILGFACFSESYRNGIKWFNHSINSNTMSCIVEPLQVEDASIWFIVKIKTDFCELDIIVFARFFRTVDIDFVGSELRKRTEYRRQTARLANQDMQGHTNDSVRFSL